MVTLCLWRVQDKHLGGCFAFEGESADMPQSSKVNAK